MTNNYAPHRQLKRALKIQAGVQEESRPLQWHRAIQEAGALWIQSGWGLADVWAQINRGDYQQARALLDQALAKWAAITDPDKPALPSCLCPRCIILDQLVKP